MARSSSKKRRDELWIRTVAITSFRVLVWSHATRGGSPEIETRFSLQLVGLLNEEVRKVRDVELHLQAQDEVTVGTVRPAATGAIIGFRPTVQLVVSFAHRDFDRLWTLALNGLLKHARIAFTTPRYSRALVTSISFSTHPEE